MYKDHIFHHHISCLDYIFHHHIWTHNRQDKELKISFLTNSNCQNNNNSKDNNNNNNKTKTNSNPQDNEHKIGYLTKDLQLQKNYDISWENWNRYISSSDHHFGYLHHHQSYLLSQGKGPEFSSSILSCH